MSKALKIPDFKIEKNNDYEILSEIKCYSCSLIIYRITEK